MSDPTQAQPLPPEPVPPAGPAVGTLVVHRYTDGAGTEHARHGVVVEALEADRVIVAWYAGVSGPLPVAELEAGPGA